MKIILTTNDLDEIIKNHLANFFEVVSVSFFVDDVTGVVTSEILVKPKDKSKDKPTITYREYSKPPGQ